MKLNVPATLKSNLRLYGINLPVDRRTNKYKDQVKKFKVEELYIQHLKDLVKDAKKAEKAKETRKVNTYLKQVLKQNEIETQRRYNKNKVGNSRRKPIELRSEDFYNKVEVLYDIVFPKKKFIKLEITGNGEKITIRDAPFKLIITDFKTGVEREMNFKNLGHFFAFWSKIQENQDANVQVNRTFYKTFHDPIVEKKFAFQYGFVSLEKIEGGYRNHIHNDNYETSILHYNLICVNPISVKNNCGIECVNYLLGEKLKHAKKKYGLKCDDMIPANILLEIYNTINQGSKKPLIIIDETYDDEFDMDTNNYILLYKNHYVVVKSIKDKKDIEEGSLNDKRTKRGLLTFDFETRPVLSQGVAITKIMKNEYGEIVYDDKNKPIKYVEYEYPLVDILCCVEYIDYKSTEKKRKDFIGYYQEDGKYISSAYLFVKWMKIQSVNGHHYNCIAHNGSRFDFYLIIKALREIDISYIDKVQFRGLSVIGIQMFSHLFKDSCCFLTNSLNNLCKNFKVETSKITSFELDGCTISNEQLCFYKPELDVKEFIALQIREPKFWKLYLEYCYADCSSLLEIWQKFTGCADDLIGKMNSNLLAKCRVNSCNTIGSHAKKILTNLISGGYDKKKQQRAWNYNHHYREYLKFFNLEGGKYGDTDVEKINFIKNFKRGGISHCNQAGKHTQGVASVDITSQYPTAMMCMKVPAGESEFIECYDDTKYGYYHITDAVYENADFKPSCGVKNSYNSLNWAQEFHTEDYLDSFMIEYLMENHGLKSFNVVKGLVSNTFIDAKNIFGRYVETLFQAKAEQDVYKSTNDEKYNPALREVIKLYLNSLSGKLVEDPSKYGSITIKTLDDEEKKDCPHIVKDFNGTHAIKQVSDKENLYVGLGVMIYSYSKRLLFEYINLLPEKSNSVIATETDSIYFSKKCLETLEENCKNYEGEYPVAFGSNLGNIKIEKCTTEPCYFLGKKFYYIAGNYVIKGIPKHTIDDAGNKIELVNMKLYDDIYNWKQGNKLITRTFKTIKKSLYGKTELYATNITRTITPSLIYKEY